jgi:hypothetical protein
LLSVVVADGCTPYSYSYTFTPTAGAPVSINLSSTNRYLPSISGTFDVTEEVDETLIGGFIVKMDDQMIDASVASQLTQLKQRLTK